MLLQDVRYAARTLLKNKVVTILAVLCLALGIGVNTTIFAVVDGVLMQPFPYTQPEQLVVLNETHHRSGVREDGVSYQNLRDWREQNTVFTAAAAVQYRSLTISDREEPERYQGAAISWDLFPMLGTRPAIGRVFTAEDDRPGAAPVVLLSDDIWEKRYGRDASVIGRSVLVNAQSRTIVGVMPARFNFPENQKLWVPLAPEAHESVRSARDLFVVARLKPGMSMARANTEMNAIAKRLATLYPDDNDGWAALVRPLRDEFIPDDVELVILAMMGAVTFVLLIACANVANLLLARASVRQREISICAALGAGRRRIVRQLLTESLLLGLISTPLGVAIAWFGVRLLDSAIPPNQIPYYIHWQIDGRALAYTVAIAAATGILFGLAPALQAARLNLFESLKEGGRGSGASGKRARVRNALVIAEVALSLVLLVGAALFVRSFLNLQKGNGGFQTAPLMTLRFHMAGEPYAADDTRARRAQEVVSRIEELPGVQAAFASNLVPLSGGGGAGRAVVEGRTVAKDEEPLIGFTAVTPHLFRTLNLPLERGRTFTDMEGAARMPVAVINHAMAAKLWPKEDPVGRRFRVKGDEAPDWFTVIGVAPDFMHEELDDDDDPPFPAAYVPYPYGATPNTGLTIRVAGDPAQIMGAVRATIRTLDPNLPLFNIYTMEELKALGFWQFKLFGWMFSIFGAIALLLASVGVYGVLSYAVSQRSQEIGVRVALGAERGDVLRLVVGQGLRLAGIGIALGLAGAFGVTRLISTLLYNVTPTDPVSFTGVSLFLAAVAFLASYVPARRATGVDPIIVLRSE